MHDVASAVARALPVGAEVIAGGPHGLSQVVMPQAFEWHDAAWRGLKLRETVLYEMHVGTFTPEGNWLAAALQLPRLRDLGITAVEVMPVADFPGKFGWGYDGAAG